jgi:hypothetical protein
LENVWLLLVDNYIWGSSLAQSSGKAPFTSEFVDSIIAIDENEMSRSTLYRKSWVFSGCYGFLPQGKLAGWVRINTVKNNAIVVIVKIKYTRKN